MLKVEMKNCDFDGLGQSIFSVKIVIQAFWMNFVYLIVGYI